MVDIEDIENRIATDEMKDFLPGEPCLDAASGLLAYSVCRGRDLPDHFGNGSFADAHLLLGGMIAAQVHLADRRDRSLAAVRDVISGESFFDFCCQAMTLRNRFVQARLDRYALPGANECKSLNAIRNTTLTLLNAYLSTPKLQSQVKDKE